MRHKRPTHPEARQRGCVTGRLPLPRAIVTANSYNNRLQPVSLTATNPAGAAVLSLTYNFNWGNANNGNVLNILNNRNHNRDQSFNYDELNRLKTAQTDSSQWGNSYVYDIWGNLLQKNLVSGKLEGESLSKTASLQNQLSGEPYDIAGNQLRDALNNTLTYDAENRISCVGVCPGIGGVAYTYDGDGERVRKSTGKLYWTGMGSDPLVETSDTGTNPIEYIFFNGKRTARRDTDASVHYFFSDHLGSADVITNASGSMPPEQESDYYPFGGERVIVAGPNNYKFTGQERDAETNLDYFGARYYASNLGRFITPDEFAGGPDDLFGPDPTSGPLPYADIANPQSLNKYAYVYNNPLGYVDPNGHSALDFLAGAANAIVSDNTFGANRAQAYNSDFKDGQTFGDVVAGVQGIVETALGAGLEVGGLVLDATGVGAAIGIPAGAAATVAILHGASTTATATTQLALSAAEPKLR